MAAITLLLLAIGLLFAFGMFAVVFLLRIIGNRAERKDAERREKKEEASP